MKFLPNFKKSNLTRNQENMRFFLNLKITNKTKNDENDANIEMQRGL